MLGCCELHQYYITCFCNTNSNIIWLEPSLCGKYGINCRSLTLYLVATFVCPTFISTNKKYDWCRSVLEVIWVFSSNQAALLWIKLAQSCTLGYYTLHEDPILFLNKWCDKTFCNHESICIDSFQQIQILLLKVRCVLIGFKINVCLNVTLKRANYIFGKFYLQNHRIIHSNVYKIRITHFFSFFLVSSGNF